MKTKTISLAIVAFFLAAFAISFASANENLTVSLISYPQEVAHNAGFFIVRFNITNNLNQSVSVTFEEGSSAITSGIANITRPGLQIPANSTITMDATVSFPAQQAANTYIQGKIKARTANDSAETNTFSVKILASNSITLTKVADLTKTQNGAINLTNTGNTVLSNVNLTSSGDISVEFQPSFIPSLTIGESRLISVVPTTSIDKLQFGTNKVDIRATSGNVQSNTLSFTIKESFCKAGKAGSNLTIDRVRIKNKNGDEDSWKPLDEITVDVDFSNEGNSDLRDVVVELGFFNPSGKNVVRDLDFSNSGEEKIEYGRLKEGKKDKVTFEFRVPADFDINKYKLAVKVYSKNVGETKECIDEADSGLDNDLYQEIEIEYETSKGKYIVFDNVKVAPTQATCGETITLNFNVYNIGDVDEDQVKVILFNRDLKVNLFRELKGGLDSGDSETVSLTFTVPNNVRDGTYNLELSSEYDYNSRLGRYNRQSDNRFIVPISILGCTQTTGDGDGKTNQQIAAIAAELGSEAKAGEKLVVTAIVSNLQSRPATFTITASDYESWATLESIEPSVVNIGASSSTQLKLTFNVKEDAVGEQSFSIEARSGQNVVVKDIVLNIEGKSTTSFIPFDFFAGNALIWIIGIVNLILVILIIIVAIRISRK